MFVVDTNVLLYAVNRRAPEHEVCRGLVEGWRRRTEPWHLTWNVLYEFLSVATHPNTFERPWSGWEALDFIDWLREAPSLTLLDHSPAHSEVLARLVDNVMLLSGGQFHDAHTVALMHEHGVRTVYTRDADFRRFVGIQVIDPLSA